MQEYVAYLDLGNGMTEAAMERWASTGTVPGKPYLSNLIMPFCPLYIVHSSPWESTRHIFVTAHRVFG